MALLGVGKKDRDGRQVRIEHRGKYLRASRTGGVALRASARASGVGLTVNSSHGVRVSTAVAPGLQVAMQNNQFVLRGRYSSGPLNLNLSKSGVSASVKNSVGTFNFIRPNR